MEKPEVKNTLYFNLYGEPDFGSLNPDKSWAFEGADTKYLTHNIHRYPAKFIPQVVKRIISEFSNEGDTVLDPFCGSGTALLEARLLGRNTIGVDMNPIAYYISKIKASPIEPQLLERLWAEFSQNLSPLLGFDKVEPYSLPNAVLEVLNSWIPQSQLLGMRKLFALIMEVENEEFRDFLLVNFSNIQKDCSWWLMKSVKPTKNFNKKVPDVIPTFIKQVEHNIKKNKELWNVLRNSGTWVKVFKADARNLSSFITEAVDLIVFSPPYVTSYEYADIHKLSIIWLEQAEDLKKIKQKFIGSLSAITKEVEIKSSLALKIVRKLSKTDDALAKAVKAYFEDMNLSFIEMDKVLKSEGVVAIVIGNTKLKKVNVKNAEVFTEMFISTGYKLEKVVKRPIPGKNLPSLRDPSTGKFTSAINNHVKAYPHEFILFFRKR